MPWRRSIVSDLDRLSADRADLSVVAAELAIFALVPLMNRGKDVTKLHETLLEKAELERADAMTLKARQQPVLARRPSSHRPVQSDE